MSSLSHWLYALAAFYAIVCLVVYWAARKPSCRMCVYRESCEDRSCSGAGHFFSTPHHIPLHKADQAPS